MAPSKGKGSGGGGSSSSKSKAKEKSPPSGQKSLFSFFSKLPSSQSSQGDAERGGDSAEDVGSSSRGAKGGSSKQGASPRDSDESFSGINGSQGSSKGAAASTSPSAAAAPSTATSSEKANTTANGTAKASKKRKAVEESDESGEDEWDDDAAVTTPKPKPKAKKVIKDDDDGGDSDYDDIKEKASKGKKGSGKSKGGVDDGEDEDDWMDEDDYANDDDEDGEGGGRGRAKASKSSGGGGGKRLKKGGSGGGYSITDVKTPSSSKPATKAKTTTGSSSAASSSSSSSTFLNAFGHAPSHGAKSPKGGSSSNNGGASGGKGPAMDPQELPDGVVAGGMHMHNNQEFLYKDRRDKKKRKPDHPDYDPTTLYVPDEFMKSQTPAMKQWWTIKSENMDTILFFKVGKFYELFHMDADVGVNELEFIYMKGDKAHSGFPEIAYGKFADALVNKGYRVARVEQVETPEMMKERNNSKGGKKDKVVRREVCSVLSRGTRTYCFLDDVKDENMPDGSLSSANYMLSITEKALDPPSQGATSGSTSGAGCSDDSDEEGDDGAAERLPPPTCEYGITLSEAATSSIRLGQFADTHDRSRLRTMLSSFMPVEVLFPRGELSETTMHMIKCIVPSAIMVPLRPGEQFWEAERTVRELHRGKYFVGQKDKKAKGGGGDDEEDEEDVDMEQDDDEEEEDSTAKWPKLLQMVMAGGDDAALAMSALGGLLCHLQRALIDHDTLTMRRISAYVPPDDHHHYSRRRRHHKESEPDTQTQTQMQLAQSAGDSSQSQSQSASGSPTQVVVGQQTQGTSGGGGNDDSGDTGMGAGAAILSAAARALRDEEGEDGLGLGADGLGLGLRTAAADGGSGKTGDGLGAVTHMVLDGVSLNNLEVLCNSFNGETKGSLWAYMDRCHTPFGRRLLREWVTRPLLQAARIETRLDAVEELLGELLPEADATRKILKGMPDIERLLARVHSMASLHRSSEHPDSRAVMYEGEKYSEKKLKDFTAVVNGLTKACKIPEAFAGSTMQSTLLQQCCRLQGDGDLGHFPDMRSDLLWLKKSLNFQEEGNDCLRCEAYDKAKTKKQATVEGLEDHLQEQRTLLKCKSVKWFHQKTNSYQLDVPSAACKVQPAGYNLTGKTKTAMRYQTNYIVKAKERIDALQQQMDEAAVGHLRVVFDKFDKKRHKWMAAVDCLSHLDALLSLADVSSQPGYSRPRFYEGCDSFIRLRDARHPCLEQTYQGDDFIPNDVMLGNAPPELMEAEEEAEQGGQAETVAKAPRLLMLSGPNMGGKSTLLRQVCLVAIMSQIGCFAPASSASLTPFDRIFTRVGASDRILAGQSTFYVELAETANILHHATNRSLVILDELGRGTSTFDGTAIAHAVVKFLVKRASCLALFATHYHSLVEEWGNGNHEGVGLGHMDCLVEGDGEEQEITFLYKLVEGACPKSFGINVARLAKLPEAVIAVAKAKSLMFEQELAQQKQQHLQRATKAQLSKPKEKEQGGDAMEVELDGADGVGKKGDESGKGEVEVDEVGELGKEILAFLGEIDDTDDEEARPAQAAKLTKLWERAQAVNWKAT